jgi:hypothetical protein
MKNSVEKTSACSGEYPIFDRKKINTASRVPSPEMEIGRKERMFATETTSIIFSRLN